MNLPSRNSCQSKDPKRSAAVSKSLLTTHKTGGFSLAAVADTDFGGPKTARFGLYAGVGWGVNVIDSVRSEFNGGAIIDASIVSRKAKSQRTKERPRSILPKHARAC